MDMIQTFRIMTDIDDLEASDFFTMNPRETRGHGKKIIHEATKQAELEEVQFLPQGGRWLELYQVK